MKTIIVPTDFSTCAEHATVYAANLARTMNASILLVHVFQLPVTMSDFPVLIVSADELKRNADEALRRANEAVQKAVPDVQFETESRMGDVVEELEEVCTNREVVALVTGTKDMSGFERFLLGSTTLSLVKKCSYPVIAVPEGAEITTPKRIALALDFLHDDEVPVARINALVQELGAELHIVHVEQEGEDATHHHLPEPLRGAAFHSFREDDVTKGIQHFVSDNGIDLVIVLPHKHNLYERLFFKGHTKGLINAMPVPVLCIRQ